MDDVVLRAIAKWPNVPNAYHWLSLDARGQWLLKGDRITNPAVTAFIGRNYGHDERGRWFFQNGPQRVFVACDLAPLIFRTEFDGADMALVAQTGASLRSPDAVFIDELGRVLFATSLGPGACNDRDLATLCARIQDANGSAIDDDRLLRWLAGEEDFELGMDFGSTRLPVRRVESSRLAAVLGFDPSPAPAAGEPEC